MCFWFRTIKLNKPEHAICYYSNCQSKYGNCTTNVRYKRHSFVMNITHRIRWYRILKSKLIRSEQGSHYSWVLLTLIFIIFILILSFNYYICLFSFFFLSSNNFQHNGEWIKLLKYCMQNKINMFLIHCFYSDYWVVICHVSKQGRFTCPIY